MEAIALIAKGLGFESTTFLLQVGLFTLLHFVLKATIYKSLMDIRDRRDARMAKAMSEAESAVAESRALKEEYEAKVLAARTSGQTALASLAEKAELDRKSRVEVARARAAEVLEKARAEAKATLVSAEAELESQSERVADAIAQQLVKSSLIGAEEARVLAKLGVAK